MVFLDGQCVAAIVAGLILLALALALQPLTWSDPVPSAADLATAHSGG